MAGADDRGKGERGAKRILSGDDLPSEDAIPPAGSAASPRAGDAPDWDDDGFVEPRAGRPGIGGGRLALDDDDRLPWLESADDIGDEDGVDGGRVVGFVLLGLVALALIVGAVWFVSNRAAGPGPADGSLVRAEPGPYKVRPENPGGARFEGTGDASFAVSEGQTRDARLGQSDADDAPAPAAAPSPAATATASVAAAPPAPAPASGGVGVQVGAYMNTAQAEAGWATLVQRNPVLSGLKHRVVEGRADIGTVYRLQAVAADVEAAKELCATLTAGGLGCQVKR